MSDQTTSKYINDRGQVLYVFERNNTPLGAAIRFPNHNCDHVAVVAGGILYEAVSSGVRRELITSEIEKRLNAAMLIVRFDVGFDRSQRSIEFLEKQIDKPYNWRGLIGFYGSREWPAMITEKESWFCSELALACSIAGEWPVLVRCSPEKIGPWHLVWSPAGVTETRFGRCEYVV